MSGPERREEARLGGDPLEKVDLVSIPERKRIVKRIAEVIEGHRNFLILGHKDPDDDCIASMVAFALLVSKFNGRATILTAHSMNEHHQYLLNICAYNSISIVERAADIARPPEAIVVLDTPKPDQIEFGADLSKELADPAILKIEIDHHIGADARYVGSEGYRLVTNASSTCELIGYVVIKMEEDAALLERHQLTGLLTRNIVLAVLTGIVSDSQMGKYLKSSKETWYYHWFSKRFERLLERATVKGGSNFSSIGELFSAMGRVSGDEKSCYGAIMAHAARLGAIGIAALGEKESAALFSAYSVETIVAVAKSVADALAEQSGQVGIVAYFDAPELSDFVQFRMRRSQNCPKVDLVEALARLGVSNGGGHQGAVGFRYEKAQVADARALAETVAATVAAMIAELG